MKTQAEAIRAFLLHKVPNHPTDIVSVAVAHFSVSRMTVHRHLETLIKSNQVVKSGATRNIQYHLTSNFNKKLGFKITPELSEFDTWEKNFTKNFSQFQKNINDIFFYSFTEMFNNAIEHSEGKNIIVFSELKNDNIILQIKDDGVGIFYKIATSFSMEDLRESILQLSIGKLTTDPRHHTGEGIFFTSRAVDLFEITANGLKYCRNNDENDWAFETINEELKKGTCISMTINRNSKRNLTKVFEEFQDFDTLAFNKTEIIIALSRYGEERFVSRSQAKRVLRNLDKFRHVILNFQDVRMLGQGFADEVFRVYPLKHPNISITYINASEDVEFMIKRCLATAKLNEGSP